MGRPFGPGRGFVLFDGASDFLIRIRMWREQEGPELIPSGAAGVHGSVDDAVNAAKEAFEAFKQISIEKRKRAIDCIRRICVEQSQQLGKMEMDETQIGRLDHKIEKLITAGEKSPGVEFLRSNVYSGDHGLTVEEFAPFGVIAAITPVTHSLPTLANNAISMLASGNVVVVNAHPSGANVAKTGSQRATASGEPPTMRQ